MSPLYFLHAVFGWLQDSFTVIERDSAYNLSAGYLKGAEQAGARMVFNIMTKLQNARKQLYSVAMSG